VQYERWPLLCHHCYVIGHNVTTCKWLHPEATQALDRGKKAMVEVDSRKQKKNNDACASTSKYVPIGTTSGTVVNKEQNVLAVIEETVNVEQSTPIIPTTPTISVPSDTAIANDGNLDRSLVETTITAAAVNPFLMCQLLRTTQLLMACRKTALWLFQVLD
jgi:hypothetical protein